MHVFLLVHNKTKGGVTMKISDKDAQKLIEAIIRTAEGNGRRIRKKPQKKKTSRLSS